MTKLKMLRSPLKMAASKIAKVQVVADRRITGRRLQARRLAVWRQDPTCAVCGRVVDYPGGFELDHKVPLFMGGETLRPTARCSVSALSWSTAIASRPAVTPPRLPLRCQVRDRSGCTEMVRVMGL